MGKLNAQMEKMLLKVYLLYQQYVKISQIGKILTFSNFEKRNLITIQYVTNWGEAGLGWRPARPTTACQGFPRNTDTIR